MGNISITTKNIRTTAASRLAFDDLKVSELVTGIGEAADDFATKSEALRVHKEEYQHAQASLATIVNDITRLVTENYHAEASKVVQAELDRKIKAALANSEDHMLAHNRVYNIKLDLDNAQHEFDVAKINHRTLATQTNVVGATLNFLAASKTARSAALAHLSEL